MKRTWGRDEGEPHRPSVHFLWFAAAVDLWHVNPLGRAKGQGSEKWIWLASCTGLKAESEVVGMTFPVYNKVLATPNTIVQSFPATQIAWSILQLLDKMEASSLLYTSAICRKHYWHNQPSRFARVLSPGKKPAKALQRFCFSLAQLRKRSRNLCTKRLQRGAKIDAAGNGKNLSRIPQGGRVMKEVVELICGSLLGNCRLCKLW